MATTKKSGKLIVDGPSKFDLMVALFVGRDLDRKLVEFSLRRHIAAEVFSVRIDKVARVSPDDDMWYIRGFAQSEDFDSQTLGPRDVFGMEGKYSTKTRMGEYREIPWKTN